MLRKISVMILVATVLAGCSSEDEKKNRTFQESVHAFINTNKDIIAYGHADFNQIMSKGKFEANPMISMVAGAEIDKLKAELDLNTPMYYAVEKSKDRKDARMFFFLKLKDEEKLVKDMKAKGYVMKGTSGITYTEDGDFVVGLRGPVACVIVQGGDYKAAEVVEQAFKMTEGKLPDSRLKARIERAGDITMSLQMDAVGKNIPAGMGLSASDLKGMSSFTSVNFEKGQAIMKSEWEMSQKLRDKMGMSKSPTPIVSEKLVSTANGSIIGAVQLSFSGNKANNDVENMATALTFYKAFLGLEELNLSLDHFEVAEGIKMPDNGQRMGDELMEMFIDFDALTASMDTKDAAVFLKELDYSTFRIDENKAEMVVKTHRGSENILVTLLELASGAAMTMMGGGSMMM